jgi:hypothetical protein
MFGDFDCLNPVLSSNSGSDRARTPQQQSCVAPSGPIRRVAGADDPLAARRVSSREKRSQSAELRLAREIFTSQASNITPSRRPASRKKERKWENNNLIPVLKAGYKLPNEYVTSEEDYEGTYDSTTGKFKLNMDVFKMKIAPRSLFSQLFLPENANVSVGINGAFVRLTDLRWTGAGGVSKMQERAP